MQEDFSKGVSYLLNGISFFYKTPSLWKYSLFPFLLTLVLYGLILFVTIRYGIPFVLDFLPDPDAHAQWLRWLIHPLRWLAVISCYVGLMLFSIMTLSSVYELLGALFFDGMVVKVEQEKYRREISPLSFQQNLFCALQSGFFSIVTMLISLLLFFSSLFLPGIGLILMALFIGYRIALTYLFSSGFNRGLGVREITQRAGKRKRLILGFGTTAYLLLLIPFAAIFLIPGFVVSGVLLYNEELEKQQSAGK